MDNLMDSAVTAVTTSQEVLPVVRFSSAIHTYTEFDQPTQVQVLVFPSSNSETPLYKLLDFHRMWNQSHGLLCKLSHDTTEQCIIADKCSKLVHEQVKCCVDSSETLGKAYPRKEEIVYSRNAFQHACATLAGLCKILENIIDCQENRKLKSTGWSKYLWKQGI